MDNNLRSLCENRDRRQCDPAVRNRDLPRELKNGESIPLMEPDDTLDGICMKCPIGLFEADKWECPICGNKKIESNTFPTSDASGVGSPSRKRFFYHCTICGKQLVSYNKELR